MKKTKNNLKPTWTKAQVIAYCHRTGTLPPRELSPASLEGSSASPPTATAPSIAKKKPRASIAKKRTMVEFEFSLILKRQLQAGEILGFDEQSVTIVVGEPQCRYTPDFAVWLLDGRLKLIEVKGPFEREDGVVKYKSAIRQYPHIEFEFWKKDEFGQWSQPYAIE